MQVMSPAGQRQDSPGHSAIMSAISASSAARLIISAYRRASAAPTEPIADQWHQVAEYVAAAGRVLEPEHPVGAIQRVEQAAYPRGGDRQGAPPAGSSPRPSSGCPAATHCRAAALSAFSSASSCADPRCSISRDPRRDDHTTCTAVAPDFVFHRPQIRHRPALQTAV
jgi:hypothetical protein